MEGRAGEVAVEDGGADDCGDVEEDKLRGHDDLRTVVGLWSVVVANRGERTLLSKRMRARLR